MEHGVSFGNLEKPRAYHGSVYLNGQVSIIGGYQNFENGWMKTEIGIHQKQFSKQSHRGLNFTAGFITMYLLFQIILSLESYLYFNELLFWVK